MRAPNLIPKPDRSLPLPNPITLLHPQNPIALPYLKTRSGEACHFVVSRRLALRDRNPQTRSPYINN